MSPRYAVAVVALAVVALVPTVIHNYLGLTADIGARVAGVDVTVPGMAREATPRKVVWFRESFETEDALEYVYRDAVGASIKLTVIRGYNAKLLFHHPENVVAYGRALHEHDIVELSGLPGVPVHRLRPEGAQRDERLALYVLSYDHTFVRDPVMFQLRLAWALLLKGRAPMTLVFVQSEGFRRARTGSDGEGEVLRVALRALGLEPSQTGGS